jgi:hypothetical protein
MKNIEIFIPTWPDAHDLTRKIGTADYGRTSGISVESFKIAFRAQPSTEAFVPEYHYRCWQDIGMTIFVQSDGGVSVCLRVQDVYSADVSQLEQLLKTLKWAVKRQELLALGAGLKLDSLPFYLMNLCTVLGIHRTVQYHGPAMPDTYAPVSCALELIVAESKRRWERLQ